MSQFPAYFAFKTLGLTGTTRSYIQVTSQAGLIEAEFQATPGSWKLFPYTAANQEAQAKAAAAWAGAPYTGTGGTSGETIPPVVQNPASAVPGLSQIGTFFSDLGQANTWIRVGEVILGIALIGIGIAHITKVENVVSKAVRAGSKGLL